MKGNNFIWAVKQMLNGNKVTRERGFSNIKIEHTINLMGNILCCNKNEVLDMDIIWLKTSDFLAEDWVLL